MWYHETSVMNVLRSVFGYEDFKSFTQREAVIAVLEGSHNICICMPPGSGKSLCFQLPAVMQKGKVTVVFSPNISFAKSQVEFLQSKQIEACFLSPKTYKKKHHAIIKDLMSASPKIKLLYCTPELCVKVYFEHVLLRMKKQGTLSRIVFKEAHSFSYWGYNHVRYYNRVQMFDRIFGYISTVAVTTAATHKVVIAVIKDISQILKIKSPQIFRIPEKQTNVHYDVWFLEILSNPFEHLKNFIVRSLGILDTSNSETAKTVAIIYCKDEAMTEVVSEKLCALGISTLYYHHRLKRSVCNDTQKKWESGEASVMITTYSYAFLYKKPIRCIVHWMIPETIAKCHRESAEADRDEVTIHCRIYFSMKEYLSFDIPMESYSLRYNKDRAMKRLSEFEKSVTFCLSVKCRHAMIAEYFGQMSTICNNNCDVCNDNDGVEIRTRKFIVYSESMEQIKYKMVDIRDENEIDVIDTSKKKLEVFRVRQIIKDKNSDEESAWCTDNHTINEEGESSSVENRVITLGHFEKKDETLVSPHSVIDLTKWNLGVELAKSRTITQSSVNKNRLNKDVSPEPYASSQDTSNNKHNIHVVRAHASLTNERKIKRHASKLQTLKNYEILNVRRLKRKSTTENSQGERRSNNETADAAKAKESCVRVKKQRRVSNDVSLEHLTLNDSDTVQLVESKSINVSQTERTEEITNENPREKCVKDRTNVATTSDSTFVEYLMAKYKLNKDAITLIPRGLSAKSN